MTNEDRDLLVSLRRQHADLQQMMDRLTSQLAALEGRAGVHAAELFLPPVPPEAFLPPLPEIAEPVELPPIPAVTDTIPLLPPVPAAARVPVDSTFSRWLLRLGIICGMLFLALLAGALDSSFHLDHQIGLLGRFGLVGLAGTVVLFIGDRFDHGTKRSFFGRLLIVAGLLGLFGAFYEASVLAATAKVPHPIAGGGFLLVWTFYALLVAERHRSHLIGIVGIALGYLSMSLVHDARFSMGASLCLTALTAAFLLWRGWTLMASVGAIGAYLALFHRLVFDSYGDLVLDTSRTLPFLPPAVYLAGTWAIFTTAIILCTTPAFRGGKRLFFASLNNAGMAFLLALSAYISGYGLESVGWALFDTGLIFLVVSRLAGFAEHDPVELMGAYAAQGLALFTAGVVVVFSGITRAIVLLLETLLLGIAGAFAGDRVLITATYAAGFFATVFAIWQIAIYAHHPWLFGLGGALVMLINAWSSRGDVRYSKIARSSTVFSTTCYCLLALALIFAGFNTIFTDASLPVALAVGAVLLTFAIYHFSIYELPSLAQILMLAALVLVLFPVESGEELPGWTLFLVAAATLGLLTWWSRQRITIPGPWIVPVCYLYAFALVYIAVLTVQPYLDAEGWMMAESLIACAFLIYGVLTRVWSLAIAGQILLVLSLCHVFFPPQTDHYPWLAGHAVIPVLLTFAIGRGASHWLHLFPELSGPARSTVRFLADVYKLVALLGMIRLIFAFAPATEYIAAFFFLGTLLVAINVRQPDSFGARCGLVLSSLGVYLCVTHDAPLATALNTVAVLLFLAQLPLLVSAAPSIISHLESWTLTLAAVFTGWYFTTVLAWPHHHGTHSHLTLTWALFALFLFILGLFSGQGRLRWCGLAVLGATMLRVLSFDLWTLPVGLRVLTLFFLAIITLGIVLGLVLGKNFGSQKHA